MLEQKSMMDAVYTGILPACAACGFTPVFKDDMDRKQPAVYARDAASVIDFASEKGKLRIVFSNNRIHLLSCAPDVEAADDSMYNLDGTFLMILEEYDKKDIRSVVNEMSEQISESYTKKTKITSKKGAPSTVSKASVRSGASSFDPYTLASKLAVAYPELKNALHENVEAYGDFLCEDFFLNHANPVIRATIVENNPTKVKKLFTILGEMYEDGTNACQSLIAVTVLGEICREDKNLMTQIIPYLTDSMLEPVSTVMQHLNASKSARARLDNPPTYKPKKKKQGLMDKLMGAANAQSGLQQ
ncbi:MAG: hypothetical protein IJO14_01760 [Clostridia bacterium]|nr:hypothetical protein [Clostridia bacterium]